MSETLRSVGLDVGTTSTQMILSELKIENQASAFAVPKLEIADRQILYKSDVHFTPLLGQDLVDADALRRIVEEEYRRAGIARDTVDTGAIIITGETSRKENARAVLEALSHLAGEFVVATAGPDLESVLAAKGAGAAGYSEKTGKTVLHMDIGGGTANLALIRDGKIVETGCLNVGGRLLKFNEQGIVTYVSPVVTALTDLRLGAKASRQQVEKLAAILVQALEMAAGLRERTSLLDTLTTAGTTGVPVFPAEVISFSGGVADCIEKEHPWLAFGDFGPVLGQAIRNSRLCAKGYVLGQETIRATVIGAGCHSTQLSGSTVFCRNVKFPLKNLPVVCISEREQTLPVAELARLIDRKMAEQDTDAVLALPGLSSPDYQTVVALAQTIRSGLGSRRAYIALEQDMAKALGQALALSLPKDAPCLCLDRVQLSEGSFLDVGEQIGPALPVVIKTLILSHNEV